MTPANVRIRLTPEFRDRMDSTGMTDAALAAAIGVTPQFFHQVKTGKVAPSAAFMAGAVLSRLATDFSEAAEIFHLDAAAKVDAMSTRRRAQRPAVTPLRGRSPSPRQPRQRTEVPAP